MYRTTGWLHENAQRRYPFTDNCNLVYAPDDDVNTHGDLPNDVLLDFSGTTDYPDAAGLITLTGFTTSPTHIDFAFHAGEYTFTVTVPETASLPYRACSKVYFKRYMRTRADEEIPYDPEDSNTPIWEQWGDVGPMSPQPVLFFAVFGAGITRLRELPAGTYNMLVPYPRIRECLVTRSLPRVDSLRAQGHEPVWGIITAAPGYNCETIVSARGVHLSVGAGLGVGPYCKDDRATQKCSDVALFINGLPADHKGDFKLAAGAGVQLTNNKSRNKITISASTALKKLTCLDVKGGK